MNSIELRFRGTDLTIEFDYQPATIGSSTEPPSDEEVDITAVIHFGDDIIDLLHILVLADLRVAVLEAIHGE